MKARRAVTIVTGGASGIGNAVAQLFASRGNHVVVADKSTTGNTRRRPGREGDLGTCSEVVTDVTSLESCRRAVEWVIQEHGTVDVLINCAGVIFPARNILDTTEEEWDMTLDVNLKGVFLMSKTVIPHLASKGSGSIINISSVWGVVGAFGAAAYCASKGGVVMLTKAMAIDHARDGIRVNCICPGSVDTPMLRHELESAVDSPSLAVVAGKHALGRVACPDEIAESAWFMASNGASFITGSVLMVDGGRTAGEQDRE